MIPGVPVGVNPKHVLPNSAQRKLALEFAKRYQARIPKMERRRAFWSYINRNATHLKAPTDAQLREGTATYIGEQIEKNIMQKTVARVLRTHAIKSAETKADVYRLAQSLQKALVKKDMNDIMRLSQVIAMHVGPTIGGPEKALKFIEELISAFEYNRKIIIFESEKANH
jgi:hypothetical protein